MQQHSLMPAEFFQKLELTAGSKTTHLRAISGSDSEAKTGELYNVSPRKIVVIKGLNARIKDQAYWEGDDEKGLEGIMHLAKSIKRDLLSAKLSDDNLDEVTKLIAAEVAWLETGAAVHQNQALKPKLAL